MTVARHLALASFIVLGAVSSSTSTARDLKPTEPSHASPLALIARLPLRFEANEGQWDERVRFVARRGSATLLIHDDGMTIGLAGRGDHAAVTMTLVAATPSPPRGTNELVTKSNFFLGADPKRWRTNVPNFAEVRAEGWLPGVDVVWHGRGDDLEYDLEVAAGTSARDLAFDIEGAERIGVTDEGSLEIATSAGTLVQRPPKVVQDGRQLRARYTIRDSTRVGFAVDGYDERRALVIDPVLAYSTYLGATLDDNGYALAVDSAGNAYVTGRTNSTNFPIASAYQGAIAATYDAFVTKLNAAGNALVYSTYLGGNAYDQGTDIAVDATGSTYVTGWTTSTNFPTQSAYQSTYGGAAFDAFVTKLNASGSALAYSTYLGGNDWDRGNGIALDGSGSAYVIGTTKSPNFPLSAPYQAVKAAGDDAFVTKLSPAGTALTYSTFLGGNGTEFGDGIAVDGTGAAFLTGYTSSTNFPTQNAFQATYGGGGSYDAFVTKLNAAGSALTYSTYLGGAFDDLGVDIAVDAAGSAYVTGYTASPLFPTAGALQSSYAGNIYDAFVTKMSVNGGTLVYSTFLGGSSEDRGASIAVDATGAAYVAGSTYSPNFPTLNPIQSTLGGLVDAFVTKLTPSGSALVYSTYFGGSSIDPEPQDVALGASGSAYVMGNAASTNVPTLGPYQSANAGGVDSFIAKIADAGLPAGSKCANTSACGSGLTCVDGTCCTAACTDGCAACDVTGFEGTCTAVTGPPHGSRPACAGAGVCAGTCDGKSTTTCAFPQATSSCGSMCANGIETSSSCDGKGACVPSAPRSCNDYSCTSDGSKCRVTCATAADCRNGLVCKNGACVVDITPPVPPTPTDGGGCSCNESSGTSTPRAGLVALAVAFALVRARRRRAS